MGEVFQEIIAARGYTALQVPPHWWEREDVSRSGHVRVDGHEVIWMTSHGGRLVRVWAGPAGQTDWYPAGWERRRVETVAQMCRRIHQRREQERRRAEALAAQKAAERAAIEQQERRDREAALAKLAMRGRCQGPARGEPCPYNAPAVEGCACCEKCAAERRRRFLQLMREKGYAAA